MTVAEAARVLGVSEASIRGRVRRGTIAHQHDEGGNLWITVEQPPSEPNGEPGGQPPSELVGVLEHRIQDQQERIQSLEWQLADARERDRETRRLLAAALERIPAIEAPPDTPSPEPRGSPQTASEEPSGTPETSQGYQEEERRERSFWRRLFGG